VKANVTRIFDQYELSLSSSSNVDGILAFDYNHDLYQYTYVGPCYY
jgi:hypothetical protein